MIQNENIENPSQKLILLSDNMFECVWLYCATFSLGCGWGAKVSQHPVYPSPCSLWVFFQCQCLSFSQHYVAIPVESFHFMLTVSRMSLQTSMSFYFTVRLLLSSLVDIALCHALCQTFTQVNALLAVLVLSKTLPVLSTLFHLLFQD